MHPPRISVFTPDCDLPPANDESPFAVLLDTRDMDWSDDALLASRVSRLYDLGCRYYVCFGPQSERVHDRTDDIVQGKASEEAVMTTFHDDETLEDVVHFFRMVALNGMAHGVILARDGAQWLAALCNDGDA